MIFDVQSTLKGKKAQFDLKSEDLLSFCDCLSLIRNETGLIAWGDEDLFLLCADGKTTFHTATAQTIEEAVSALNKQVQDVKLITKCFLVLVVPKEKVDTNIIENVIEKINLQISDAYVQLYIREDCRDVRSPVIREGKLSNDATDLDFIKSSVTVYLLANEGCSVGYEELFNAKK